MKVDILLAFSLVAIIISVVVPGIEYFRDYKLNRVNLEADYYRKIYAEHLVKNIPYARKYIRFDSQGILCDVDRLISALQGLMQDSLYFLYSNEDFYYELKKKTQELEDYLVQQCGESFNGNEQQNVLKKIQELLNGIYHCISKGYNGQY